MQRRIGMAGITGLGGGETSKLDNKGKLPEIEGIWDEATDLFFDKMEGFDYTIARNGIAIGIEPSYRLDPFKVVFIANKKEESFITNGVAFGWWGSDIVFKTKKYSEYKHKGKFVKFIDKWHGKLFENNKQKEW